ncbi:MAG: disulfide bond formation protein DsbA [Chloroflexi bacterium 13_1_40CM_4_68_4]|nr:MAG: disulfide bond formation protein DsbA [Chloroflexi bacterium 13_1_40CM_4_68_4]
MTPRRTYHAPRLTLPVGPRDHIRGPSDAPVTLLEYGDYECPFCGAAHPVVKQIEELMAEQLRLVFRHFPITTLHPHAELAAEAAEAAGAQHRFWEMHDWIYQHQDTIDPDDLRGAAARLGLDLERYDADVESHRFAPRIREDFMSGVRSGVNGTPTFFINGARHDGDYELETLLDALREALLAEAR